MSWSVTYRRLSTLPRRNSKATQTDFEKMSGAKIKALEESLHFEWRQRMGQWSERPAPMTRW
jgi:hypothetical protein